MEQQDLMRKKKKRNPLLVFVSVFYLFFGGLFVIAGGLACYGLVLQGEALLAHSTFPALAIMTLIGLLMLIAGIRGLFNRAGYIMGALVIALGAILVIHGLATDAFNPTSIGALVLGGLYTLGARIGKRS
ncbi:MAG: hypothetical protein IJF41_04265 [Clostridia bacterium]|nr:hypothetical protein [Clostridia bacterium]